MKKTIAILALLFLTGAATAQTTDQEVTSQHGLVNFAPGSALYGLEVAFDSVTQKPDVTAQERAAEYREAVSSGDEDATQKALDALAKAEERASGKASKGLETALKSVNFSIPETGSAPSFGGSDSGVGNVEQAADRLPF